MSTNAYPVATAQQRSEDPHALRGQPCGQLVELATMGAMVGATGAAATTIGRMQRGEIDAGQAIAATARAGAAAAAATAIAGVAANAVASQGLVRLGVLFITGTAVMHAIRQRLTED